MITATGIDLLTICLEGFLYGKISVLCALICALAKEVQLFPGPGLYSGIFAIYLQCPSTRNRDNSRTPIVFYALCILYILSTVNFVADFANLVLDEVSNNSICNLKNLVFLSVVQFDFIFTITSTIDIGYVQIIVSGCCDFIAQSIIVRTNHCTYRRFCSPNLNSAKTYRCWIVWGHNIRVVIIPSFLAIAYLGQSIYFHLISRF